jgi:hypothetical protein
MLTVHRLSFPTCLFHPRSIHLLCHLDSPSAANLPCLGLQQQTGPEVSELCGSYRVPSRSSLLPLRTLSPGERVAHRPNHLFFQPQSPLSPGERVLHNWPTSHTQSSTAWSQQPTGKTDTGFPTGSTMAGHFLFLNPPTQDRLTLWLSGTRDKQSTQGSTQVRTVQTGDVPAIPEQTQIHAFSVQRMHEGFSAGVRPVHLLAVEGRMEEEPLSRLILAIYSHAPGLTLVTLGTACVPSACIRFARFPLARNLG